MTTLTINIDADQSLDAGNLAVPDDALTTEALRGAIPVLDKLSTLVKTQPDAMIELVRDYQSGRMDKVETAARNLGLLPDPKAAAADAQLVAPIIWVIRIIVAIIIILLFPKGSGRPPVKPPTQD